MTLCPSITIKFTFLDVYQILELTVAHFGILSKTLIRLPVQRHKFLKKKEGQEREQNPDMHDATYKYNWQDSKKKLHKNKYFFELAGDNHRALVLLKKSQENITINYKILLLSNPVKIN